MLNLCKYGVRGVTLAVGLTLGCSTTPDVDDRPSVGDRTSVRALVIDPATFGDTREMHRRREMRRMMAPPTRSLSPGPVVDLLQPQDNAVVEAEKLGVHVKFSPTGGGADPDMATLSVWAEKEVGFLWLGKDITKTVQPYVTGNVIRAEKVDLKKHTGRFRFTIGIQDRQGGRTEKQFHVTVLE